MCERLVASIHPSGWVVSVILLFFLINVFSSQARQRWQLYKIPGETPNPRGLYITLLSSVVSSACVRRAQDRPLSAHKEGGVTFSFFLLLPPPCYLLPYKLHPPLLEGILIRDILLLEGTSAIIMRELRGGATNQRGLTAEVVCLTLGAI